MKKTFEPNERLMFVTYQPKELTLDYKIVAEHTYTLFGSFRYVEVLEQTYLTNNLFKSGKFIDGFHSHILMRECDYLAVKDDLRSLKVNVVGKFTYDLSGLTEGYLLKQAGVTYNRVLPTQNIPFEPEMLPEPEQKVIVIKTTKVNVLKQNRDKIIAEPITTFPTLKINKWHRYIDDT